MQKSPELWARYLEMSKSCSLCHAETKRHGWVKMVNPRSGKIVPYAWVQKSLPTYIPVCKQCCDEDKHLSIVKVEQKVAHTTHSGVSNTYTPQVVSGAYIGPAPKWLRMKLKEVCAEASIRFDMDVKPVDLLDLVAPDEPTKAPETVGSTPHVGSTPQLPTEPPKLATGFVVCPGCQIRGVKQVRLDTNPDARCSICKPEQFDSFGKALS